MTSNLTVAVLFLWTGMVLAISFLEAPLKFRAPGITIPLGLGIGRLVFRALNTVETVWAVVLLACLVVGDPRGVVLVGVIVAVTCLAGQIVLVRPRLARRSDAVLAGGDHSTRSRAHYGYVAFEVVKLAALLTAGITALP